MKDLNFKPIWRDEEGFAVKLKNVGNERDMNESDIRSILNDTLQKGGFLTIAERNAVSRNENPFDLVSGDESALRLCGFEIKGDKDNFNRLKDQARVYINIFDEAYLVLHKKEKPEWLPEQVGVLRIFENGDIYSEKNSYYRDPFDIGSDWEWDTLLKSNGLGTSSARLKKILNLIRDIRRNILFNRFFAVYGDYKEHVANKFWPLDDEQKELLIGFDVPYHFKNIEKEVKVLEKKIALIKKITTIEEVK